MNWSDIEQSFKTETKQLLQKYSSSSYNNYPITIPSAASSSGSSTFPEARYSHSIGDDTNSFKTNNGNTNQILSTINSLSQKVNDLELSFQNKTLLIENVMLSQNESKMKLMKLENDIMRELNQNISQQQLNFQKKLDSLNRQCDQLVLSLRDQPSVFVEKISYNDDLKNMQALVVDVKRDSVRSLGLLESFADAFHELTTCSAADADWLLHTSHGRDDQSAEPPTSAAANSLHNNSNNSGPANLYQKETLRLKQSVLRGIQSAVTGEAARQSERMSSTVTSVLEAMTTSVQALLQDVTAKYSLLHAHVFELEAKVNDCLHYKRDNTDIQDSLFKLTQSLQDQQTRQYHAFAENLVHLEDKLLLQLSESLLQVADQQAAENDEFKKYYISHKIALATHASRIHELESAAAETSAAVSHSYYPHFPPPPPATATAAVSNGTADAVIASLSSKIERMEQEIQALQQAQVQQRRREEEASNSSSRHSKEVSESSAAVQALTRQQEAQTRATQTVQDSVEVLATRLDALVSVHMPPAASVPHDQDEHTTAATATTADGETAAVTEEPAAAVTSSRSHTPTHTPTRINKNKLHIRSTRASVGTKHSHSKQRQRPRSDSNNVNSDDEKEDAVLARSVRGLREEQEDMKQVVVDVFHKLEKIASFSDARDLVVQELAAAAIELKAQLKSLHQHQAAAAATQTLTRAEVGDLIDAKAAASHWVMMSALETSSSSRQQQLEDLETELSSRQRAWQQQLEASLHSRDTAHVAGVESLQTAVAGHAACLQQLQQAQETLSDDVDELKRIAKSVTVLMTDMTPPSVTAAAAQAKAVVSGGSEGDKATRGDKHLQADSKGSSTSSLKSMVKDDKAAGSQKKSLQQLVAEDKVSSSSSAATTTSLAQQRQSAGGEDKGPGAKAVHFQGRPSVSAAADGSPPSAAAAVMQSLIAEMLEGETPRVSSAHAKVSMDLSKLDTAAVTSAGSRHLSLEQDEENYRQDESAAPRPQSSSTWLSEEVEGELTNRTAATTTPTHASATPPTAVSTRDLLLFPPVTPPATPPTAMSAAMDDSRSVTSTTSYRSQAMRPQKLPSPAATAAVSVASTSDKNSVSSDHRQTSHSQSEDDDDDDFKFKVHKNDSNHKSEAKTSNQEEDDDDDDSSDSSAGRWTSSSSDKGGKGGLDAEDFVEQQEEEELESSEESGSGLESSSEGTAGERLLESSALSSSLEDFTDFLPVRSAANNKNNNKPTPAPATSTGVETAAAATLKSSLPLLNPSLATAAAAGQTLSLSRSTESLPSVLSEAHSAGSGGGSSSHPHQLQPLAPITRKVHTLSPLTDVLGTPGLHSRFPAPAGSASSDSAMSSSSAAVTPQNQQCSFCLKRYPTSELSNHAKTCDLRLEDCPNHCGRKIMFLKLHQHLKECAAGSSGSSNVT